MAPRRDKKGRPVVAITGMGIVTPLGTGFGVLVRWALITGSDGPGRIELYRNVFQITEQLFVLLLGAFDARSHSRLLPFIG